jgi:hypothetical protein
MWITIHIGVTSMKTIQMTIEPQLTRLRKTTRSALIRTALEAELRRERINDLEARHSDGYARLPAAPGEFDAWIDQQDWGV